MVCLEANVRKDRKALSRLQLARRYGPIPLYLSIIQRAFFPEEHGENSPAFQRRDREGEHVSPERDG